MLRKTRVLALCLILTMFAVSCNGISTVIKYTKRAIPLLQAAGVDLGSAQQVIDLGEDFDSDPKAATLAALTVAFDRLVAEAQQIPEQGKRTAVLVLLVSANIALQELADKYLERMLENPNDSRLGIPRDRATIRERARRPIWQCRDARTGQYRKMEFCKENPDISVVETR